MVERIKRTKERTWALLLLLLLLLSLSTSALVSKHILDSASGASSVQAAVIVAHLPRLHPKLHPKPHPKPHPKSKPKQPAVAPKPTPPPPPPPSGTSTTTTVTSSPVAPPPPPPPPPPPAKTTTTVATPAAPAPTPAPAAPAPAPTPATPTISSFPPDPTNQASATFAFASTTSGATYQCSLDGAAFANCASPKTYPGPLSAAGHTFKVQATLSGKTSGAASDSWTIDLTPPPVPQITARPDDPTSSKSATFAFKDSEGGVTFVCSLNGGPFAACTSPTVYTGLAEGSRSFAVKARDAAGNLSAAATDTWTIDLTPPAAPTITSGPPVLTASASATFTFIGAEAGGSYLCRIDGGAFVACTTPRKYGGLADGSHTFSVASVDAAGNVSTTAATRTWMVDTTPPPQPTIPGHPPDPSGSSTAVFTFADAEANVTYSCKLDSNAFAPCGNPVVFTGLDFGDHHIDVAAVDAAGNRSSNATFHWKIVADADEGLDFTINGSVGNLAIGVPTPVPVTITNPNSVAIYVTQLTFSVVAGAAAGTCDASNFAVTPWLASGPADELLVPANATSFPVPLAKRPLLTLLNLPTTNQNNCKGKTVTLNHTGSAHSA